MLQWRTIHHSEILEQVGHLHGIALGELGELVLPIEKSLREVVPDEEVRPNDDLPEICQGAEGGMRLEPLTEKSPHLGSVALSLRHDHPM